MEPNGTHQDPITSPFVLSRKAVVAIKLHPTKKQFQLAAEAGLNPTLFSHMVKGRRRIKKKDPRIVKLGELLGIRERELFQRAEAK